MGRVLLYVFVMFSFFSADLNATGSKTYIVESNQHTMFGILLDSRSILECKSRKFKDHITVLLKLNQNAKLTCTNKKMTGNKTIPYYKISRAGCYYVVRIYLERRAKYISCKCLPNSVNVYVKNKREDKFKVLIDAGHGGKDPGSVNSSCTAEKNITLAYAKAMKDALEQTGRYNVLLTRDSDIYVSRRNRLGAIRRIDPDVFISVHADNISNKDVSGVSVYTYKPKRKCSSDKIAKRIFSHDVSLDSSQLATMFLRYVPEICKIKKNVHRKSHIAILSSDTPSILIETGYISNEKDKTLLDSDIFKEKLSKSLVYSLDDYFVKD